MIRLFKKIDRFFNPQKYFEDHITKPMKDLELGDMVYVLEVQDKEINKLTRYGYLSFLRNINIYGGRIVNMHNMLQGKDRYINIKSEWHVNPIKLYIKDVNWKKDHIYYNTLFTSHLITTNKKVIIRELEAIEYIARKKLSLWKLQEKREYKRYKQITKSTQDTDCLRHLYELYREYKEIIADIKYKLMIM